MSTLSHLPLSGAEAPAAGLDADHACPEHACLDHVRPVTALLAAHVPLTLLLDLAQPRGPRSLDLGEPGDAGWLR